jgi:hypothetical protein
MPGLHQQIRRKNAYADATEVHQKVMRLRRAVITDAVTLYGWTLTEHGNLSTGVTTGPCARCSRPTRKYGPNANPLCQDCR